MKKRRIVNFTPLNNRAKLYGYSYYDLAILFNLSVSRVRHLVLEKKIVMGDLLSICTYWNTNRPCPIDK